jgi:hypothetical protein
LNVKESEEKSMTAYEELKAWCEKHLTPDEYRDVPTVAKYYHCIYMSVCIPFNADEDRVGFVSFYDTGSVANIATVAQANMNAHIKAYEEQSRG